MIVLQLSIQPEASIPKMAQLYLELLPCIFDDERVDFLLSGVAKLRNVRAWLQFLLDIGVLHVFFCLKVGTVDDFILVWLVSSLVVLFMTLHV